MSAHLESKQGNKEIRVVQGNKPMPTTLSLNSDHRVTTSINSHLIPFYFGSLGSPPVIRRPRIKSFLWFTREENPQTFLKPDCSRERVQGVSA